jgi:hypothetical protein
MLVVAVAAQEILDAVVLLVQAVAVLGVEFQTLGLVLLELLILAAVAVAAVDRLV